MKPLGKPLNYDESLALVLRHAPALGTERIALRAALGRVLREDIHADRDQPPFDRAAMDGFAVRSGEVAASRWFPVKGTIPAGASPVLFQNEMPAGAVMRIATGAPLPRGADAVAPIEQAMVENVESAERVSFVVPTFDAWQNVHRRGVDAKAGNVVLKSGTRLSHTHIGIAAAVGAAQVVVSQRPRITLLTTGDEIVPCEAASGEMQPQQVRNSNGPMLAALLESLGAPLLEHRHLPDEPEETLAAAREALSRSHLVITNGGVSVGQRDHLPWAWKHLGLHTILHGVAIQPGRPLLVCGEMAECGVRSTECGMEAEESWADGPHPSPLPGGEGAGPGRGSDDSALRAPQSALSASKLVLGLPGNPVSVLATAHLFVCPVLALMLSGHDAARAALPWRAVTLREPARASGKREVFRAARLHDDGSASIIAWHGSGDLMHTAEADGFVRLPLRDEEIPAGGVVRFLSFE